MKLVFVILLVLAICVAAVGIAYILPGKKRTSDTPQTDLLSPDSMVKVTPAGPGRLRMSIPQGDRMPMEVMLQITEIKEETDLDKLKDPKRTPEEKQDYFKDADWVRMTAQDDAFWDEVAAFLQEP